MSKKQTQPVTRVTFRCSKCDRVECIVDETMPTAVVMIKPYCPTCGEPGEAWVLKGVRK